MKGAYNPLTLISADKEQSVDDAARIAEALVIETTTDAFFSESARHLLQMIILHVGTWRGYTDESRTLVTVRNLVTAGDLDAREIAKVQLGNAAPSGLRLLFDGMIDNPVFDGIVVRAGIRYRDLLEESPRTFMSILQTACTNTDFIDSPGMARVLSQSRFAMHELKTLEKGMSLFLCLPQRMMETHFRWLRMMTTLTLTEMERWQFRPVNGYPVLVMLDEFASLKRMRAIENAAAQIAGYHVKLVFVTQTLVQLKELYKDNWETLLASCGTKIFLNIEDHFTRDYISKLAGTIELRPWTNNTSQSFGKNVGASYTRGTSSNFGNSMGSGKASSSSSWNFSQSFNSSKGFNENFTRGYSESVQRRMLLTPDEVGRFFGGVVNPAALCLRAGKQPLVLSRSSYFSDPFFQGYFDGHPDHKKPLSIAQIAEYVEVQFEAVKTAAKDQWEGMRARMMEEWIDFKSKRAANSEKAEAVRLRRETFRHKCQDLAFSLGLPTVLLLGLVAISIHK